jgi:hypothetical protein
MESDTTTRCLFRATVFMIILVTLCACGNDDNPLATGKGAILMDYLPRDGVGRNYKFSFNSSAYQSTNFYSSHIVKGTCSITINPSDGETIVQFQVEIDSSFVYWENVQNEVKVSKNYQHTKLSRLFSSADSLWYLTGNYTEDYLSHRKLILAFSVLQGGGLFDLYPFLPSGWEIHPAWNNPEVKADDEVTAKGDTLSFSIDEYDVIYNTGTVKLLKGEGIVSIDFTSYKSGGLDSLSSWQKHINYIKL